MSKALKLKWANKVARAKYFVILTDKESVIALDGVHPEKFEDVLALESQAAAIEDFIGRLKDLQKQHERAIANLAREGQDAAVRKKKATKKKVTKINVREG